MRFVPIFCVLCVASCTVVVESSHECQSGGSGGTTTTDGGSGGGSKPCDGSIALTGASCWDPDCCGPTVADPGAMCVQATGGEYPAPFFCAEPASENKDGLSCVRYGEPQFTCAEWHSWPLELWCCSK